MKRVVLLAMILALAAGVSQAAILLSLTDVTLDSGTYIWTYTASLQSEQNMRVDDYFTIFDFPGYVLDSVAFSPDPGVSDRTFSVSDPLTGLNLGPSVPDSATVENLVVQLTAGNTIIPSGSAVTLGTVTARSIYGNTIMSDTFWFGAQAYNTNEGNTAWNYGHVDGPDPTVPEPGSMGMLGGGLLALTLLGRRALRKS